MCEWKLVCLRVSALWLTGWWINNNHSTSRCSKTNISVYEVCYYYFNYYNNQLLNQSGGGFGSTFKHATAVVCKHFVFFLTWTSCFFLAHSQLVFAPGCKHVYVYLKVRHINPLLTSVSKVAACFCFRIFIRHTPVPLFPALNPISWLRVNDYWTVTREGGRHSRTHEHTLTHEEKLIFQTLRSVMKAPNEEDGLSVKQNDEKQLSGGDVSLPVPQPVSCLSLVNTLKHTHTQTSLFLPLSFYKSKLQSLLLKCFNSSS